MNIVKEYNFLLILVLITIYSLFVYDFYLKKALNNSKIIKKMKMKIFTLNEKNQNVEYLSNSDFIPTNNKVKQIIFGLSSVFVLGGIFTIVHLKQVPQFDKGDCFTRDEVINPEPKEEWHKPFFVKQIEYVVLKIGKQNYYASSTIPSLGDFPIKEDHTVKKSNCDIIFQRGQ